MQVTGSKSAEAAFQILGPNDRQVEIAPGESPHYEIARQDKLRSVTKMPVWLTGLVVTPFDGFPFLEPFPRPRTVDTSFSSRARAKLLDFR